MNNIAAEKEKPDHRSQLTLHIDMDAFFAAIEQRDNPGIRNKPVIIGGPPGSRGVASTCSYEARKFGVHSAMPIPLAQKLCPHGIFLPVNGKKYAHVSKQIMKILQRFSPIVQPVSVDEAFITIAGLDRIYQSAFELGKKIKAKIVKETGLTCSIGIAPTKILAKLASGMNKPDGLTIIEPDKIEEMVYPLPVQKLWGIGDATAKILEKLPVITIGDLARFPEDKLKKMFGKNGPAMAQAAAGKLDSPVLSLNELPMEKSVGHEHTFWTDTDDLEQIRAQLLLLLQRVGRRMRKKKLRGRTITLKLRYDNFQTLTHRTSFNCYSNNEVELFRAAEELLRHIYEKGRKIRLIGVSMSNLIEKNISRLELPFPDELQRIKSDQKLLPAVDKIKDSFGENAIWRASSFILFDKRSKQGEME